MEESKAVGQHAATRGIHPGFRPDQAAASGSCGPKTTVELMYAHAPQRVAENPRRATPMDYLAFRLPASMRRNNLQQQDLGVAASTCCAQHLKKALCAAGGEYHNDKLRR